MTNEEIEDRAAALGSQVAGACYDDFGSERAAEILAPALRELVSRAYEEAARECEDLIDIPDDEPRLEEAARNRAARCRGLKASLVQEPVSST
jgi:hypothetical protein